VLAHFRSSLALTAAGLLAGGLVGWHYRHSLAGALGTMLVVLLLGVLEVSLSFDNAVVNASVLRDMTPVWRHRFLTWGIAIAVFGMRLVFPLLVVSVVARVGPGETLRLAAVQPEEYARLLDSAHVPLGAFGGAFLGMVCLKYFLDEEKEVHWIAPVERRLARLGKVEAAALGVVLLALWLVSRWVHGGDAHRFLVAGIFGLVTFIATDGLARALGRSPAGQRDVHRASAASFLYLEVLDASFSFDGVIGAFALTSNLFVIAIGLGVGAVFVRSLTVLLVERGTLDSYRYLEHGAFWASGALSLVMLLGTVVDVPDPVTGLLGALFIGLSLWSSIRWRRRARNGPPTGAPPPGPR
jgi:hypothetical protein